MTYIDVEKGRGGIIRLIEKYDGRSDMLINEEDYKRIKEMAKEMGWESE